MPSIKINILIQITLLVINYTYPSYGLNLNTTESTETLRFEPLMGDQILQDPIPKPSPLVDKLLHARNGRPHLTTEELIHKSGFPFEAHRVVSSDGYVTTLFRIPYGRKGPDASTKPKKAVLLHHGILTDSVSWVMNSVDKALAYRLADLGNVDVWMTNNRGSYYSLDHEGLSYKSHQYWNYSFHEIGVYDVPKIIDYILDTTGLPDMYYIGHSMGAGAFLVAMTYHPEYNSKIRTFFGLAPAVFVGNAVTTFKAWVPAILAYQLIHDAILMGPTPIFRPELVPKMQFVGDICSPYVMSKWICFAVVDLFFGFDYKENNYEVAAEIIGQSLSSTSSKSGYHLIQLWKNAEFRHYDYLINNRAVYGTDRPPKYDLTKATAPVVLYGGKEDNLISPPDVKKLAENLPNVKEVKIIDSPKFNHIDFLYAKHINELLNDRIVEIIDKDIYYSPQK